MNDQDEIYCERQITALERMTTAFERLAGVRGPEQSLVRESRSDEQPDGAEERKEQSDCSEERSGVRKIVERTELMRQIDRMIDEAQRQMTDTYTKDANQPYYTAMGRSSALIDLRIWLCDIAEKRSDLPNAIAKTPPTGPNHL